MKDYFSKFYDALMAPFEKIKLKQLRKPLIASLRGKILEIGAGTGNNMEYYSKGVDLTFTDISKEMVEKEKKRANRFEIKAEFSVMPAEKLKFKNNSFDTVVATLVLCSVDDPVKALREMKRVCKKGGVIVLLEHVRSSNEYIASFQKLVLPLFHAVAGCNPYRNTLWSVRKAGLKPISVKNVWMGDIVKEIVIKKRDIPRIK